VKLHEGAIVEVGSTAKNPESIPLDACVQGTAKLDSVTEWFFETNWKWIVSPSWPITEEGLKTKPPSPTRTLISAAEATRAEARAKVAKENIMSSKKKEKLERLNEEVEFQELVYEVLAVPLPAFEPCSSK